MDSYYFIAVKAHSGMGMLLVLLSLLSLLLAATSTFAGAKSGLLKGANGIGIAETAVAGLVTLTGLLIMIFGPFPLTTLWMWASLVLVIGYSVFSKRVTKPARLAAATESSKWLGATVVHVGIVFIAFWIMKAKPF